MRSFGGISIAFGVKNTEKNGLFIETASKNLKRGKLAPEERNRGTWWEWEERNCKRGGGKVGTQ